ncbi:hypothetical protein VTJ04DRAFT_7527 [Mycothermus thermophilus]|uniref:uncharacterized protein n=1 Tax=Humicola insolens TaxID=85995 RepID=UPI003743EE98
MAPSELFSRARVTEFRLVPIQGTQQRIFKDNGNGPATAIDACILTVFPSQELNFLFFCVLETTPYRWPWPSL